MKTKGMMDNELIEAAWAAREKAYAWKSGTKVGCAIRGSDGDVFTGWNVEGRWMTSVHAEVCAVSQLAGSYQTGIKIAIVADAKNFTPCGACLDWLIQFCDPKSTIVVGNLEHRNGQDAFVLKDLYPLYPRH